MIVLTEPGDTPYEVANRLQTAGFYQADLARCIERENRWTMANKCFGGCGYYAGNIPIWVPGKFYLEPMQRRQMIERLQIEPPSTLMNLGRLMQQGHDPLVAAHAQALTQRANQIMVKDNLDGSLGVVKEVFMGALEFTSHRMDEFEKGVSNVREAMLRYRFLDDMYDFETSFADDAKADAKKAIEEFNGIYSQEIQRFNLSTTELYGDISSHKAALWAKGMILRGTKDLEAVIKVGKYLRWLARGIMALTVVCDLVDVFRRMFEGKPWFKKFLEDAADIAASVVIGFTVAALITSGGWVAILAAGAISAGLNGIADYYINKGLEKIT